MRFHITLIDLLCAAIVLALLWGLVSFSLLFALGNCYEDRGKNCGLTIGGAR